MNVKKMDVKKEIVMPIVVLTAVCIVVSLLLAVTNSYTAPVIEEAAKQREDAVRIEILPDADSFEPVEDGKFPDTVKSVYRAENGAGFVFTLEVEGYGGKIGVIMGIDSEGHISDAKVLSHTETAGLGSKLSEPEYTDQYKGKGKDLENIEAISGATVSSRAFESAVKGAFEVFESLEGGKG
jgi:electron transport complex protein RnfG